MNILVKSKSRERYRFVCVLVVVCSQLAACASRPKVDVLQPVDGAGGGRKLTILTATNRTKEGKGFSSGRSETLSFERYEMSIPPTHTSSKIELPEIKPDARRDIVVTDRNALSRGQFLAAADTPATDGSVGIFVHGYNYTYQEGLFRLAQVATDSNTDGTPVLFSWPSEGALAGYVADRDAALYSRDDLVWLVSAMANRRDVKRVILFGHSVGAFLIMETLRQLKLEGRGDILRKLVVILAAPDIDEDVFRSQLDVIGGMETPLTLFVSKDDKALALSGFLGGERTRVGRLDVNSPNVKRAAEKYGLRIVDITSVTAADGLGHDRYANLAGIGPQLAAVDQRRGVTAPEAGAFVLDVAASVVSSPFRLAGSVVGRQ